MAKFNPGQFLREVRTEGSKIVWPTRAETMRTAILVLIMTSILGVFFFAVDSGFSAIVRQLIGLLG